MNFWPEFFIIAGVHLLALASPGPDFAIILRYAVRYGKTTAIIASLGIGCAILFHVTLSLVGIGLLIKTTPWLYRLLTIIAALYLCYLAFGALRSKAANTTTTIDPATNETLPASKAFYTGLLTNCLNPKATLFFLSLFAVVISAQTPMAYKVIYGLYMAVATALWFCMLSMVLTLPKVRTFLLLKGYWFDRAMGVLLLALAIHILLSDAGI